MLSGTIRAAKTDGSAAYTLMGISFLYGIFHAAGPGHGKAVISSYLVANDETWRRGIALSFASAILQAFTAIAIVGVAAVLLNATAHAMGNTVRVVEMVSYALIVVIGLRLLWVKGRAFLRLLRPQAHEHQGMRTHARVTTIIMGTRMGIRMIMRTTTATRMTMTTITATRRMPGAMRTRRSRANSKARIWLRRGLTAIVAVGVRPCSGAIIVLRVRAGAGAVLDRRRLDFRDGARHRDHGRHVATLAVAARDFAGRLAKGKPGAGMLFLRGVETAAALLIIVFGAALLTGYMVSEQMVGV